MEITDVRIRKVNGESKMKALASVTFDHQFVVHEIRVIDGQNGLFIAMPSRKMSDGEYRDIAHPLDGATRQMIQEAVLTRFHALREQTATAESEAAAGSETAADAPAVQTA